MSENELDQIKGMIAEFSRSGVLRLPYTERVVLGLEIAKMAPAMLARIRALEAERDAALTGYREVVLLASLENAKAAGYLVDRMALTGLLRRVLAWRGLDGDGIDEPLRTEIEEAL